MTAAIDQEEVLRRARAAIIAEILREPPSVVQRVTQNLKQALGREYLTSHQRFVEVDTAIGFASPSLAHRIRPLLAWLSIFDAD